MTKKQRIDRLLHKIAVVEANLGTDSTPTERKIAEFEKDLLAKKIENIDPQVYKDLFLVDK